MRRSLLAGKDAIAGMGAGGGVPDPDQVGLIQRERERGLRDIREGDRHKVGQGRFRVAIVVAPPRRHDVPVAGLRLQRRGLPIFCTRVFVLVCVRVFVFVFVFVSVSVSVSVSVYVSVSVNINIIILRKI